MGEMGGLLVIGLALLAAFGGLGAWIAAQKRRAAAEGALLGALFGPVGVLVEALLPDGDARPKPRAKAKGRPVAWDDPLGLGAAGPAAEAPPASELPFLRALEGDAGRRLRVPPEGDDPLRIRTG
jgi:hypothetical protein